MYWHSSSKFLLFFFSFFLYNLCSFLFSSFLLVSNGVNCVISIQDNLNIVPGALQEAAGTPYWNSWSPADCEKGSKDLRRHGSKMRAWDLPIDYSQGCGQCWVYVEVLNEKWCFYPWNEGLFAVWHSGFCSPQSVMRMVESAR